METPDTYLSFVIGYGALWLILFFVVGLVLVKIRNLEQKLKDR